MKALARCNSHLSNARSWCLILFDWDTSRTATASYLERQVNAVQDPRLMARQVLVHYLFVSDCAEICKDTLECQKMSRLREGLTLSSLLMTWIATIGMPLKDTVMCRVQETKQRCRSAIHRFALLLLMLGCTSSCENCSTCWNTNLCNLQLGGRSSSLIVSHSWSLFHWRSVMNLRPDFQGGCRDLAMPSGRVVLSIHWILPETAWDCCIRQHERSEILFSSLCVFFDNGLAVCMLNKQISKDHRQDHSIKLFSLKGARFDFSLKAKKRWMDFKCTERCVPTERHGFLPCYAVHFSKKRGQKCMENRVGSRLAD